MRHDDTRSVPKRRFSRLSLGVLAGATLPLVVAPGCGAGGASDEGTVESRSEALVAPVTVSFQNGLLPTTAYAGTLDATIRQAAATTNYGNATTCEIDGDDGSGADKSCLVRWDVTSIPLGSTVESASITFRVTDSSSNVYDLHPVLRNWTEANVTWNDYASGSAWQAPGALGNADRGSLVGTITGNTGYRSVTLNAADERARSGLVRTRHGRLSPEAHGDLPSVRSRWRHGW
jgi:hypothetical protein